jgi:hypothetical protein
MIPIRDAQRILQFLLVAFFLVVADSGPEFYRFPVYLAQDQAQNKKSTVAHS